MDFRRLRKAAPILLLIILFIPTRPCAADAYDRDFFVPILAYHRISDATDSIYSIAPSEFRRQMEGLARGGYRVIPLSHLVGFILGNKELPERAVVLTFDDAYTDHYRIAYPLLKRYGFPATYFVYTDAGGRQGNTCTWEQLREMHASGLVDIQSHTCSHASLVRRKKGETAAAFRSRIRGELVRSKTAIEREVPGARVHFLAYPYGSYNSTAIRLASEAGYIAMLTSNIGVIDRKSHLTCLERRVMFRDVTKGDFAFMTRVDGPVIDERKLNPGPDDQTESRRPSIQIPILGAVDGWLALSIDGRDVTYRINPGRRILRGRPRNALSLGRHKVTIDIIDGRRTERAGLWYIYVVSPKTRTDTKKPR